MVLGTVLPPLATLVLAVLVSAFERPLHTRAQIEAESRAARPWRYDRDLDLDLEGQRKVFAATLVSERGARLTVRAPPGSALVSAARAKGDALIERLEGMGLPQVRVEPMTLTLYASLEQKGSLTRNTRPEQLDARAEPHAALPAGRTELDLWSVAAARLVRAGASADSRFLEPAASWLVGRFGGEPLSRAVRRLSRGRLLPSAEEAATVSESFRSSLIWGPARALLVWSIHDCVARTAARTSSWLAILGADPPPTLAGVCRRVGVSPAAVAVRYVALAESLSRVAVPEGAEPRPRRWRTADGFQRGMCLAHSVSLTHGYLSADADRQLGVLRQIGANWVSLTPFGYLPDLDVPEIRPSAESGPEGESDEAVCEVAARARRHGLRVWLKPHLWSRDWVGNLQFTSSQWDAFFDQYRAFLLHYALLAEREGMDGLLVGHELPTATLRFPGRWRRLIAEVRGIYGGTLTYGAHWQDEVQRIEFWDALDLVGVSFYAPLSERPTRSVRELEVGAQRALERIRRVAIRAHRPVLIVELGYAQQAEAPVRPWEERSGPLDLETQRSCYQAMVLALGADRWVAGVFWWKWFTADRAEPPAEGSFSPQGRPAERVIRAAFRDWEKRPVRAP